MLDKNIGGILGTVGKLVLTVSVVSTIGLVASRTRHDTNDLYMSSETRIFDKNTPYAYSEMLEFAEALDSDTETESEAVSLPSVDTEPIAETDSAVGFDTDTLDTAANDTVATLLGETVTEASGAIDNAENVDAEPYEAVVYWVKNGEVWHLSENCPSLSRSKSILKGTVAEAMESGKARVCKRCGS